MCWLHSNKAQEEVRVTVFLHFYRMEKGYLKVKVPLRQNSEHRNLEISTKIITKSCWTGATCLTALAFLPPEVKPMLSPSALRTGSVALHLPQAQSMKGDRRHHPALRQESQPPRQAVHSGSSLVGSGPLSPKGHHVPSEADMGSKFVGPPRTTYGSGMLSKWPVSGFTWRSSDPSEEPGRGLLIEFSLMGPSGLKTEHTIKSLGDKDQISTTARCTIFLPELQRYAQ